MRKQVNRTDLKYLIWFNRSPKVKYVRNLKIMLEETFSKLNKCKSFYRSKDPFKYFEIIL